MKPMFFLILVKFNFIYFFFSCVQELSNIKRLDDLHSFFSRHTTAKRALCKQLGGIAQALFAVV